MDADLLREKVRGFCRRDAWTAGRKFFEAESAREPRSAPARAGLGFFCLKETRYDTRRAASELAEALRLDPALAPAHAYLAVLLACLQDAPGARAAAAAARRCGARPAEATLADAYVELDTGSLDLAIGHFRRLTELEGDSTSWILLSQALSQAGRHEEALECARKAGALDPEDFRAHAYAGVHLARLGRFDDARRELERALGMNDAYALTHHTLAFIARERRNLEEAERRLRRALAVDPDYVCSRQWLAELCAKAGRTDEARAHYRRALSQFPDWKELRLALDALDH